MNDSDNKLIKRLAARDESVLAEIDERYGRLCETVARNILGSDADAEECRSDALMKIWSTIPPAEPTSLKSYAAMAARSAAINRYNENHAKKRGGEILPLEELAEISTGSEVSEAIEARELGGAVNEFLAACSREERVMFVRRYVFCEPPKTVADALGIGTGALNARLFRLRGRLREYLKERELL